MRSWAIVAAAFVAGAGAAQAQELRAEMYLITPGASDQPIGQVLITSGEAGTKFVADLHDLPPGQHGFHVHMNGNCGPGPAPSGAMAPGMAAGGHLDPEGTDAHRGPEGAGHLGDLPVLTVQADGRGVGEAVAPRIKDASQLAGRALMLHAGGDNYEDTPAPNGGGGDRIACGIIQ